MKDKFVKKFMRMARFVGEDQPVCYSRQIGSVIVDPENSVVLSTGYNGPPRNTPHTDSREYLREFVWPQLTKEDKQYIRDITGKKYSRLNDEQLGDRWSDECTGCQICPRRLIGAKTGQRTELCSCAHSERNALDNAIGPLKGAALFLWAGVGPCHNCATGMIQKGIRSLYYLEGPDYEGGKGAFFLLNKAHIKVVRVNQSWVLSDEKNSSNPPERIFGSV